MKLALLLVLLAGSAMAQVVSAPPWRLSTDGTYQTYSTHGVTTTSLRLNPQTLARPLCNATRRGTFWATYSASGFSDTLEICSKGSDDSFTWALVGASGGSGIPTSTMTWNGGAMAWNGVSMIWN